MSSSSSSKSWPHSSVHRFFELNLVHSRLHDGKHDGPVSANCCLLLLVDLFLLLLLLLEYLCVNGAANGSTLMSSFSFELTFMSVAFMPSSLMVLLQLAFISMSLLRWSAKIARERDLQFFDISGVFFFS